MLCWLSDEKFITLIYYYPLTSFAESDNYSPDSLLLLLFIFLRTRSKGKKKQVLCVHKKKKKCFSA